MNLYIYVLKKREEFGNNVTDYKNYLSESLQPGMRVKLLRTWRDYNTGQMLTTGELATVTSRGYYRGSYGCDCVKIDTDSGRRDVEVLCSYIEIIQ